MSGYIMLSRDIERHWIWFSPRHFQWWVQLIFMAAYEPRRVNFGKQTIDVERGQIATTTRSLMKAFCATNHTVFSFLRTLEDNGMITRISSNKMTLITVVNYDKYQLPGNVKIGSRKKDSQQKVHRILHHTKEINKEENNIHITSREGEQKFFEELRQSQIFWEETAMSLSCDIGLARKLGEKFFVEVLAKESYHGSLQELKQHLVNWLRIALRKDVAPNNQKTTNYKSSKNEDERYAVRRGTGVSAHTADDYRKPF